MGLKTKQNANRDVQRVFNTLLNVQKKIYDSEIPFTDLDEFEDYKEIYAEAKYLRGQNLYAAMAANAKTTLEFVIYYDESIEESMRIINKANNKMYYIESILPLNNERIYMILRCYEVKHNKL